MHSFWLLESTLDPFTGPIFKAWPGQLIFRPTLANLLGLAHLGPPTFRPGLARPFNEMLTCDKEMSAVVSPFKDRESATVCPLNCKFLTSLWMHSETDWKLLRLICHCELSAQLRHLFCELVLYGSHSIGGGSGSRSSSHSCSCRNSTGSSSSNNNTNSIS